MPKKHQPAPILYAFDSSTGNLTHIDSALPGQDNLLCPSPNCRHPMIPVKRVTQKIAHFRHKGDGFGNPDRLCRDPNGVNETIVHELGKLVIKRRQRLVFQPKLHEYNVYRGEYVPPISLSLFKKNTITKLLDVELEKRSFRNDYQADVSAKILISGFQEPQSIIIEICYQNPVGDDRLKKLREINVAAVEINLRELQEPITEYEVERSIMKSERAFKWLHYPEEWISNDDVDKIRHHENAHKQAIDKRLQRLEQERIRQEKKQAEEKERARQERIEREEARAYYEAVDTLTNLVKSYVMMLVHQSEITPTSEEDNRVLTEYETIKLIMQAQLNSIVEHINHTGNHLVKELGISGGQWLEPPNRLETKPYDYLSVMEKVTHSYRLIIGELLAAKILDGGALSQKKIRELRQHDPDLSLISQITHPGGTSRNKVSELRRPDLETLESILEDTVWRQCRIIVKQELRKLPKR